MDEKEYTEVTIMAHHMPTAVLHKLEHFMQELFKANDLDDYTIGVVHLSEEDLIKDVGNE